MSRTRQPSTRRIGAAERAITVLDTLAEGGELGTNEIARRTGMTPSTVSRQLGTLAASGLVERVPSSGRYRLGIRLVHLANAVLARLDVREVARPHLVALVEATRRDRDALGTRRRGRDHRRLRPRLAPDPARLAARAPVDRARDLGRQGDARVLGPGASRGTVPRVHDADDHGSASARDRDRACARARLRTGVRRARARADCHRCADPLRARRARGDRRAPGPERTLRRLRRWMPRFPCCSSVRAPISRELGWSPELSVQFDTKIAVVLRDDLAVWQKTNVTAFLVSGIAGTVPGRRRRAVPRCVGQRVPADVHPARARLRGRRFGVTPRVRACHGARRHSCRVHRRALRDRPRRGKSRGSRGGCRRTSSISWASHFAPSGRPPTRSSTGCVSILDPTMPSARADRRAHERSRGAPPDAGS